MLVQYVRTGKGKKVGVVVALNSNKIGYSLCNPLDRFEKKLGKYVAIIRAKKGIDHLPAIAEVINRRCGYGKLNSNICRIVQPMLDMEERAARYFG